MTKPKPRDRICLFCNKVFTLPNWMKNKYCSRECSSRANQNCKKVESWKKSSFKKKPLHLKCIDCGTSTDFSIRCSICTKIKGTLESKRRSPRRKIQRANLKNELILKKGGKCEKCGYSKCLAALTFHHLDPNLKEFTIDRSTISRKNINSVYKELDKCILVCFNCHMEIHHSDN